MSIVDIHGSHHDKTSFSMRSGWHPYFSDYIHIRSSRFSSPFMEIHLCKSWLWSARLPFSAFVGPLFHGCPPCHRSKGETRKSWAVGWASCWGTGTVWWSSWHRETRSRTRWWSNWASSLRRLRTPTNQDTGLRCNAGTVAVCQVQNGRMDKIIYHIKK